MSSGNGRLRRAALLATLLAVAATVLVINGGSGNADDVRVIFKNSAGLRVNSRVKIDGVPVGKVLSLEVTPDDQAVATLDLDDTVGQLGRDAQARIRPASLLGEKYVDLEPGNSAGRLDSGAIPVERTGAPVELDDLLDTLDQDTRAALAVLINESGVALSGRGADFNAALAELPPALDEAQRLLTELSADNQALGRLVEQSDRFIAAVRRERASLGRLVGNAEGALSAAADRQAELRGTIAQSPGAVRQLRVSLKRLSRASQTLRAAAPRVRLTAPRLTALLEELPPFAEAARPTLRTATEVAPALGKLGSRASPAVARLRPAVKELTRYAQVFDPASGTLEAFIDDTLGMAEGWVRAIQIRDAAAHLYRNNNNGVTAETIAALVDRYIRPVGESSQAVGKSGRARAVANRRAVRRGPRSGDASSALPEQPDHVIGETPSLEPTGPTASLLEFLLKP